MHIYKWTHTETNRSYIGQSIQEPNRRRLEHISGSRSTKKTSGWKWSDEQKEKLKPVQEKLSKMTKNKTWKVMNGKRVWLDKEDLV
jgi:hypothetical protein